MPVSTRIIDDTAGSTTVIDTVPTHQVAIEFDSVQNIFRYTPQDGSPTRCTMIESSLTGSNPSEVDVTVSQANGWPFRQVRATLTGASSTELLQWSRSGNQVVLSAKYPGTSHTDVEWAIENPDGPVVRLKVKVKRL